MKFFYPILAFLYSYFSLACGPVIQADAFFKGNAIILDKSRILIPSHLLALSKNNLTKDITLLLKTNQEPFKVRAKVLTDDASQDYAILKIEPHIYSKVFNHCSYIELDTGHIKNAYYEKKNYIYYFGSKSKNQEFELNANLKDFPVIEEINEAQAHADEWINTRIFTLTIILSKRGSLGMSGGLYFNGNQALGMISKITTGYEEKIFVVPWNNFTTNDSNKSSEFRSSWEFKGSDFGLLVKSVNRSLFQPVLSCSTQYSGSASFSGNLWSGEVTNSGDFNNVFIRNTFWGLYFDTEICNTPIIENTNEIFVVKNKNRYAIATIARILSHDFEIVHDHAELKNTQKEIILSHLENTLLSYNLKIESFDYPSPQHVIVSTTDFRRLLFVFNEKNLLILNTVNYDRNDSIYISENQRQNYGDTLNLINSTPHREISKIRIFK